MDKTFNKISKLYSDNLAAYGDQSKAVGWNTPESQELRFQKLTSLIDCQSKPITINDYGCGYGAHLDYLINKGFNVVGYNGYDLSKEMLNEAKQRLSWFQDELNLIQSADITTQADYTFVSGTFNVCFESSDDEWAEFIRCKLFQISKHSRLGFSFNLLSTYVDWQESHLFYGNPCYWFDYCKKNYSNQVSLLHDYPLYEWTLVLKKK
jgi:hypothetical protein